MQFIKIIRNNEYNHHSNKSPIIIALIYLELPTWKGCSEISSLCVKCGLNQYSYCLISTNGFVTTFDYYSLSFLQLSSELFLKLLAIAGVIEFQPSMLKTHAWAGRNTALMKVQISMLFKVCTDCMHSCTVSKHEFMCKY